MKRKSNIYKRKDGRYEGRIICHGKFIKSVYGKTYAECLEKYNQCLSMLQLSVNKSEWLFRDVALEWLSLQAHMRYNTVLTFDGIIKGHIIPHLGKYRCFELTEDIINLFLHNEYYCGNLKTGGMLSAGTMQVLIATMKKLIEYAQVKKYINVEFHLQLPRMQRPSESYFAFTTEETSLLEEFCLENDSPHSTGILLALEAGLRIGEVCALQWQDIDFRNRRIMVKKGVIVNQRKQPGKPSLTIGPPKSTSSIREVVLSEFLENHLRTKQGKLTDFVVSQSDSPMHPSAHRATFRRIKNQLCISPLPYHCLRHTFATRCIENGVDIKTLSNALGHNTVKITLEKYVHVTHSLKDDMLYKIDLSRQINRHDI